MAETWVDEVRVVVRFVESAADELADEMWVLTVDGGTIDDAMAPADDLRGALNTLDTDRPPYALDSTERFLSWGASGSSEEFILSVAKNIIGDAAKALLRNAFRRIADRVDQGTGFERPPFTREQLEWQARWNIVQNYKLACGPGDLELLEDDHQVANGGWYFAFQHDGWSYSVELMEEADDRTYSLLRLGRQRSTD